MNSHNASRLTEKPNKRWKVDAKYRSGSLCVENRLIQVEELSEIQDWVEKGPSWENLIEITIKYNR